MRPIRRVTILFLLTALALTPRPAAAYGDTLHKLLRNRHVSVFTTESETFIGKYLRNWGAASFKVYPVGEERSLGREQMVMVIEDRSKNSALSESLTRALPTARSQIGPDEVLVYAACAVKQLSEQWRVLISSPTHYWLERELGKVEPGTILHQVLDPKGTALDRLAVTQVCVVTNDTPDIARDWVEAQNSETRGLEPHHYTLDEWKPGICEAPATVFLLHKQASLDPVAGLSMIPDCARVVLETDDGRVCVTAQKKTVSSQDGSQADIGAVVAPCPRLLSIATRQVFSSLKSIPSACSMIRLSDLSRHARMVVVARPGDRSETGLEAFVNDLAGKMTSALANCGAGFVCDSRQDLKELIYTALASGSDAIGDDTAAAFREKTGAVALAVVDLAGVDRQTRYSISETRRVTSPAPPFSELQPVCPRKPDVNDLEYGTGGKKKYPDGEQDSKYQSDLSTWRSRDLAAYQSRLADWNRRRDEYDASRDRREMTWLTNIDSYQTVGLAGNLRIYDLSSYESGESGRLLFTCPIAGAAEKKSFFRTDHYRVIGEKSRPAVEAPQPVNAAESVLVSGAIQAACRIAMEKLLSNSMVPADRPVLIGAK